MIRKLITTTTHYYSSSSKLSIDYFCTPFGFYLVSSSLSKEVCFCYLSRVFLSLRLTKVGLMSSPPPSTICSEDPVDSSGAACLASSLSRISNFLFRMACR